VVFNGAPRWFLLSEISSHNFFGIWMSNYDVLDIIHFFTLQNALKWKPLLSTKSCNHIVRRIGEKNNKHASLKKFDKSKSCCLGSVPKYMITFNRNRSSCFRENSRFVFKLLILLNNPLCCYVYGGRLSKILESNQTGSNCFWRKNVQCSTSTNLLWTVSIEYKK
jgi:hypothetical protein